MTILRATLVLAALALVALIVRAAMTASFLDSFAAIAADPWGLVSLVDLYLGFAVVAVFVAATERAAAAFGWIVALFLLGNVVAAVWLAWRLPTIVRRLNSARWSQNLA